MKNNDFCIVDSHCHLNMTEFEGQIDEVLESAKNNNVNHCLTVNTKLEETKAVQEIADQYSNVFCTVGVHPHYAADYELHTLYERITESLKHKKTIGIGETGLDYYYEHSPKDAQKASFNIHIDIAKEYDIPIIIHTRDADDDTIDLLTPHKGTLKGIFHCFSGGKDLATKALDLGFYLSFSGIITFKKALEIQEVVKFAPLDRILVETDSPYLAPIPFRGKRNEPAYTRYVAEQVAHLKDVTLEDVAKQTTSNFSKLFKKTIPFDA